MSGQAPSGPIESRQQFLAALHAGVRSAAELRARCMYCFDADFAEWPLDDAALLQVLGDWLRLPQRQLQLVAGDFSGFRARHPRFMHWYRDRSHAVSAKQPPSEHAAELPCLLMSDVGVVVQLTDPLHWHGRADLDLRLAQTWRSHLDAFLQQCEPALPVTTLGL